MGHMSNLYVLYTHTHVCNRAPFTNVYLELKDTLRGLQKMFLSLYDNTGHIYLHHWPGTKTLKGKS